MGIGIVGICLAVVAAILLFNLIKIGLKLVFFVILAVVVSVTIWICFTQPEMHNPFSVNTIEYLFKINKDGSVTTTKQITETVLQENR